MQLGKERMRDREVVQLTECVLQLAQPLQKRSYCIRGNAVGKEIAAVAQALERDAYAMPLPTISPVDAVGSILKLGMRTLKGATHIRKDWVGRVSGCAPRALFKPLIYALLRIRKSL